METTTATFLPALRPAQRLGLALRVYGAVLAGRAGQVAVVAALLPLSAAEHALRQRLRERLYNGQDKAAPCRVELNAASPASHRCCAGC